MAGISPITLVPIALYILYRVVAAGLAVRRFRKYEAANGCRPGSNANADNIIPFGLGGFYWIYKAIKEDKDFLDDVIIPKFERWGYTHTHHVNGVPSLLFTCEPENIKTVLATNFHDYELGPARNGSFGPLLGKSIFTSDGAQWDHSRALFRPQFSKELINDLDSTERASQILIQAIGDRGPGEWINEIDLAPLFYRFSLDTTTKFLFGESVDSQTAAILAGQGRQDQAVKAAVGQEFGEAINVAQTWLTWRIRCGKLFWLIDGPRFRRSIRTIHRYVESYVKQAVQIREYGVQKPKVVDNNAPKVKYSLLNALAESTTDQVELRDQLLSLMVAGRDTTATLLSWVFTMLALSPEVTAKLRRAILEDIGPDASNHKLDFSRLKTCRYLQYVMNESLRLFAPVPFNSRSALRDTVLPFGGGPDGKSPIAVPAGTTVAYSVHVMHLRKDIWGPDASEFKPERWMGRKLDWSFLPFNGGPRVCLGQQYALTEAAYVIVRLLQQYDRIEFSLESKPVWRVDVKKWAVKRSLGLAQTPRGGVRVRLRQAG